MPGSRPARVNVRDKNIKELIEMKREFLKYRTLILLVAGIFGIFFVRTWLATSFEPPALSDLFKRFPSLARCWSC